MTVEELYRFRIRGSPCIVGYCNLPGQIHHLRGKSLGGGIALKPSVLSGIPLCVHHHRQLHTIGIESFEKLHGLDLVRELIFCLWGFIEWFYKYTSDEDQPDEERR